MDEEERLYTASELMKGMENKASEVGAKIVGGQTVFNPWVVTGGSVLGISD